MSDHSISIVPKLSNFPANKEKAEEILQWLISLDIVKPNVSNCTLGSDGGYAVSEGAKNAVDEAGYLRFDLITNGLEIITERQVFHTGENGLEKLICPNCKQDIASEDLDFLDKWNNGDSNDIDCPLCNVANNIHSFTFTPAWGFSNLGFTFWNWPDLKKDIIDNFKQKLGCEVDVVYTWI